MIPINGDLSDKNAKIEIIKYPSYTYKIKYEKSDIEQYVDNIEAVKQAIYKILMTDRYTYEIYNWNYGIELNNLLGKPKEYVYSEIERRIIDALSVDDRITKVYDFIFSEPEKDKKTTVFVKFTVSTIYNQALEINKEMELK